MAISARIHLHDSTVHPVCILQVDGDVYRVEDFPYPLTDAFNHRDLVRLRRGPDGSYDFLGVVTPSGWVRHLYILTKRENLLDVLEPVFRRAESEGGAAMLDFGGCLQVFLPPGCSWDPSGAVDAAV